MNFWSIIITFKCFIACFIIARFSQVRIWVVMCPVDLTPRSKAPYDAWSSCFFLLPPLYALVLSTLFICYFICVLISPWGCNILFCAWRWNCIMIWLFLLLSRQDFVSYASITVERWKRKIVKTEIVLFLTHTLPVTVYISICSFHFSVHGLSPKG